MTKYKIHSDFRTSKYRRSHVIVNEHESVHVWYPTITECFEWLLDNGETSVVVVDDKGEFEVTFCVHNDRD